MKKKILHINVKHSGGGAARVAASLHESLLERDWPSYFAYGYNTGLRSRSRLQNTSDYLFRIGSRPHVICNYLTYRYFGYDSFMHKNKRKQLGLLIEEADIVHLHVLHHYYLDYTWLFETLVSFAKNVVWTLHDCWHLTGSTPVIQDPSRWENNPESYIDLSSDLSLSSRQSALNFHRKTSLICSLQNLLFVAPSPYIQSLTRSVYPNIPTIHISNFISNLDYSKNPAASQKQISSVDSSKIRLLVIAADLSCKIKVSKPDIERLHQLSLCQVVTIGKNSPFPFAENHGYIDSDDNKNDIIRSCDVMLFTSRIDSFGLVVIETLALGIPVMAYSSYSSDHILDSVGAKSVEGIEEVIILLNQGKQALQTLITPTTTQSVLENYSITRCISLYEGVYNNFC